MRFRAALRIPCPGMCPNAACAGRSGGRALGALSGCESLVDAFQLIAMEPLDMKNAIRKIGASRANPAQEPDARMPHSVYNRQFVR